MSGRGAYTKNLPSHPIFVIPLQENTIVNMTTNMFEENMYIIIPNTDDVQGGLDYISNTLYYFDINQLVASQLAFRGVRGG